jgi:hypothetical protein
MISSQFCSHALTIHSIRSLLLQSHVSLSSSHHHHHHGRKSKSLALCSGVLFCASCRNSLRLLSFALIPERLLNDCFSPFYVKNVFAQPPRDQLFSFLNGKRDVPLTPLENDSIRKIIQEHPETCREKYPFEWYSGV